MWNWLVLQSGREMDGTVHVAVGGYGYGQGNCTLLSSQVTVVVGSSASGGGSTKNRRQAKGHWITVKEGEMWVAERF